VYRLEGVDPGEAVVMSAGAAGQQRWLILVRDGVLTAADRTLAPIGGICQYLRDPASQDC